MSYGRLSWLLVGFRVDVNIVHRIVLNHINDKKIKTAVTGSV